MLPERVPPLPVAVQVDPLEAAHVHAVTVNRDADGSASVRVALVTPDGPLLVTRIVYLTPVVPGATCVIPSEFVMERSA